MTPTDLRALLAHLLTGAAGHDEAYWLEKIGEVEKRPSVENIHSNWRVTPRATGAELQAITNAVELVRKQEPYVE
jgi:hypothetical protein